MGQKENRTILLNFLMPHLKNTAFVVYNLGVLVLDKKSSLIIYLGCYDRGPTLSQVLICMKYRTEILPATSNAATIPLPKWGK